MRDLKLQPFMISADAYAFVRANYSRLFFLSTLMSSDTSGDKIHATETRRICGTHRLNNAFCNVYKAAY